ncbi:hypothetical protein BU23DRAFT_573331 [Bimuria novae-zelandiae CBS 107.79]|uniref:Uncharacterized protein n=1 Tax=Bimuria novae-zelandiae CBS 107.79 TaxID=1447943 RepID=A0A6A5V1X4_9PLEO|nr:hypothetical protein BU23DRAFT_573331 [Bimuria novae-zelandiae CBS 107.79]
MKMRKLGSMDLCLVVINLAMERLVATRGPAVVYRLRTTKIAIHLRLIVIDRRILGNTTMHDQTGAQNAATMKSRVIEAVCQTYRSRSPQAYRDRSIPEETYQGTSTHLTRRYEDDDYRAGAYPRPRNFSPKTPRYETRTSHDPYRHVGNDRGYAAYGDRPPASFRYDEMHSQDRYRGDTLDTIESLRDQSTMGHPTVNIKRATLLHHSVVIVTIAHIPGLRRRRATTSHIVPTTLIRLIPTPLHDFVQMVIRAFRTALPFQSLHIQASAADLG